MKKFFKVIAAVLTFAIFFLPVKVLAADAWAVAAEAVGVLAVYKSVLKSMLEMGNDVNAQMSARKQDIETNGTSKNPRDIQLVDDIMNRLINSGAYELRVNSLPFVWNVNESEKFNASCYPMNYVTVNLGLLKNLNYDENKIAAVLAHELTHGIEQHSAKIYANAMAQQMGAVMLGANINSANVDWSKVAGMVNYSIAKSVITPAEYAADEGGFYLMTSAGFNPGGGAAAMAKMDYYFRYETRDFLEFDAHDKPGEQTFSDHPETEMREEKLSQLLTDYSCGHVTVKKVDRAYKVLIDGREIYTANYQNAADNAYYFAGGLARAFHDYNSVDGWNFRKGKGSSTDFLNDDKVFKQVKEIAFLENNGGKIRDAVTLAYQNENPKNRQKYFDAEKKRLDYWKKIKAESLTAKKDAAKQLRINADAYSDHGEGKLALQEIQRALAAKNQDDVPECLAIRGRAKAICGDYAGALKDCNDALAQDSKNLFNFLNRADVYKMRGEFELALKDIDTALQMDSEIWASYKLRGDIFDELGNTSKAEENYRRCYELTKKNPRSIPEKYLEKIDADAYKKLVEREKGKVESDK
ncbi:MAG: M48 family metalloprotease [Selenomonadaceae bacterium]|nr:M48 family metalloprotease [Selenomonadaceae bacterium]